MRKEQITNITKNMREDRDNQLDKTVGAVALEKMHYTSTELEMRTVAWDIVRNRLPYSSVKDWQMRVDSIVRDIKALRS